MRPEACPSAGSNHVYPDTERTAPLSPFPPSQDAHNPNFPRSADWYREQGESEFNRVLLQQEGRHGAQGHAAFNYWFHPPDAARFAAPYSRALWEEDFAARPP